MIGEKMFSKICRGLIKTYSRLYWASEKKYFAQCGDNAYIESPCILLGKENIFIGNNFIARKRLQLETISKHNGVEFNPVIKLGDNVSINYDVHIGACNSIEIDDNVLIASKVYITDHMHGTTGDEDIKIPPGERKLFSKGSVHICRNVWIGEGVAILPGVTIGENAIIGANAVVTHDIPANSVAVGVPARVINTKNLKQDKA